MCLENSWTGSDNPWKRTFGMNQLGTHPKDFGTIFAYRAVCSVQHSSGISAFSPLVIIGFQNIIDYQQLVLQIL